jgi:hypothetical protein
MMAESVKRWHSNRQSSSVPDSRTRLMTYFLCCSTLNVSGSISQNRFVEKLSGASGLSFIGTNRSVAAGSCVRPFEFIQIGEVFWASCLAFCLDEVGSADETHLETC